MARTKTKPSGYIVCNETLGHMTTLLRHDNELWKRVPAEGVLLHDPRNVTVFPTWRQAERAIAITQDYFRRMDLCLSSEHSDDEYSIVRLVPCNLK